MSDTFISLNKKPINLGVLEQKDWGFSFMLSNETDVYKAAYVYRNSPYGTEVKFCPSVNQWMLTVFNADGQKMGFGC